MSDLSTKLGQLEAQRNQLMTRIDNSGKAATDGIQQMKRDVVAIDRAFDEQKKLIRTVKLIVGLAWLIFVIYLWSVEHYVWSVLLAIGLGTFLVMYGGALRQFNRQGLQEDVENRLDRI